MVQKGFYLLEKAMSGCHRFGLFCFVQSFNIKVSSSGILITVLTHIYSSVQYYVVCSYLQSICYSEYFLSTVTEVLLEYNIQYDCIQLLNLLLFCLLKIFCVTAVAVTHHNNYILRTDGYILLLLYCT